MIQINIQVCIIGFFIVYNMAKKKIQQPQQALSPEKFIKEKARLVPIYKCYIDRDFEKSGEANIIVVRKHKNDKYTVAVFLVDLFCCGVKNSFYRLRMEDCEYEEMAEQYVYERDMQEIDYVEAHNRIFGAIAWAEEAGISPDKSFNLTQYLLEEDDDKVPLVEYEFGHNGHHCLITLTRLEASKYLPALRENLGSNFECHIEEEDLDDDDDEYDDDEYDDFDDEDKLFEPIQEMQYKYEGGDYPEQVQIENSAVEELMKKETGTFTVEDIDTLRSMDKESLCNDVKNLIMRELHRQWGKYEDDLEADEMCNAYIVGNSITILAEFDTEGQFIDVLLEVLRQNYSFFEFNFSDAADVLLSPAVYVCAKSNLQPFSSYLLEPGLINNFKCHVYEALGILAKQDPEHKQDVIDVFRALFEEYAKDLPNRTICDGSCVGCLTDVCCSLQAKELLPLIKKAYDTGCVETMWVGDYDDVLFEMDKGYDGLTVIEPDIFKRLNY